jgi:hypothetical protein
MHRGLARDPAEGRGRNPPILRTLRADVSIERRQRVLSADLSERPRNGMLDELRRILPKQLENPLQRAQIPHTTQQVESVAQGSWTLIRESIADLWQELFADPGQDHTKRTQREPVSPADRC